MLSRAHITMVQFVAALVEQVFNLRGDGSLFSKSLLIEGTGTIANGQFGELEVTEDGMTISTGGLVVRSFVLCRASYDDVIVSLFHCIY